MRGSQAARPRPTCVRAGNRSAARPGHDPFETSEVRRAVGSGRSTRCGRAGRSAVYPISRSSIWTPIWPSMISRSQCTTRFAVSPGVAACSGRQRHDAQRRGSGEWQAATETAGPIRPAITSRLSRHGTACCTRHPQNSRRGGSATAAVIAPPVGMHCMLRLVLRAIHTLSRLRRPMVTSKILHTAHGSGLCRPRTGSAGAMAPWIPAAPGKTGGDTR